MICTALILLVYICLIVYGCQWKSIDDTDNFMNREYTNILKGLCCILVVIVHVAGGYENPLQQAIGGFSQVSVTLYFLFSAYGILTGIKNKPDYLRRFWGNRIPSLMIPFVLSSTLKLVMGVDPGSGGTYFVFVLLFFYAVTYLAARFFPSGTVAIVCGTVCVYSVVGSATHWLHWPTQSLGFAYGALLVQYLPRLKQWMRCGYWPKLLILTILVGALTFVYAIVEPPIGEFANTVLQNFMVLFLILWTFMLTFRMKLGNIASKYLGTISYDVFLYHGLIQVLLQRLDRASTWVNFSSGTFLLLMLVLSILLSAGTHAVNSRVLKLLKK